MATPFSTIATFVESGQTKAGIVVAAIQFARCLERMKFHLTQYTSEMKLLSEMYGKDAMLASLPKDISDAFLEGEILLKDFLPLATKEGMPELSAEPKAGMSVVGP